MVEGFYIAPKKTAFQAYANGNGIVIFLKVRF